MEADLRLVHLQKILEQLAEADDGLGVVRDALELAEVLAVHGTEDEVAFLLRVTDVAEGCAVARKVLAGEQASLREHTAWAIV